MRIKRGQNKRRRHNKIRKLTKGYRVSYSGLYKKAKDAVLHAGNYSFAHRRKRANDYRRIWIQRINGALKEFNISYSKFISMLSKNKIEIDRKILAALAYEEPEVFKEIVKKVNS